MKLVKFIVLGMKKFEMRYVNKPTYIIINETFLKGIIDEDPALNPKKKVEEIMGMIVSVTDENVITLFDGDSKLNLILNDEFMEYNFNCKDE